MKILGIVTLYNPPKEVGENLSSYAPFLDGLYLWDNTAGGSNVDSLLPPEVAKRVLMHRRGRNVGIAMALNAAIDLALKEGYTHLLTMDQDSRFKEGTCATLRLTPTTNIGLSVRSSTATRSLASR